MPIWWTAAKDIGPVLKVKRLHPDVALPAYARPGDSGMDLRARHVDGVARGKWFVHAQESLCFGTDIAIEIPPGYEGQVRPRSSMGKRGLVAVLGTIDSGYRGEIGVVLHNHGRFSEEIKHDERIAQLVIVPVASCEVVECDELSETERGAGGFGSTGK